MTRRSHGRPTPSRGERVERRKAERPVAPPPGQGAQMQIPDAIKALGEGFQLPITPPVPSFDGGRP